MPSFEIDYWHWWILGVALVILEAFAPGVVFLWLGIAAGVVGLVLLAWPALAWEYQVVIFSLASVSSIALFRVYLRRRPTVTDQPLLNRRGMQYVGRRFTLAAPIVNGVGKLRVDDTQWKINGPDLKEGATVTVTGVDGMVLVVERAEPN